MKKITARKFLQILSILFILGGIIRIFANESFFVLFRMEALWTDHLYFIYIYKVLGAFVILTGLILFSISKNLHQYKSLFPTISIGFIIIGLVMSLGGFFVDLPLIFFVMDSLFCFIVAWFIYRLEA